MSFKDLSKRAAERLKISSSQELAKELAPKSTEGNKDSSKAK